VRCWIAIIVALAGCDHFELEARITVRDGHGVFRNAGMELERSYGFFDLAEAIEEPAMFVVSDGKDHELPLSVAGCRAYAAQFVERAAIEYELAYEHGRLRLRPTSGSCTTSAGTASLLEE